MAKAIDCMKAQDEHQLRMLRLEEVLNDTTPVKHLTNYQIESALATMVEGNAMKNPRFRAVYAERSERIRQVAIKNKQSFFDANILSDDKEVR